MIKIGISGACGKMGSRLYTLSKNFSHLKVVLLLEHPESSFIGKEIDNLKIESDLEKIALVDVLIDFSSPSALEKNLASVLKYKKAYILGTTGLDEKQKEALKKAASVIPILFSPNMSRGVNVLFLLIKDLAKKLGDNYDVEIVEAHHKSKKDAPSGTAKKFKEIIEEIKHKDIPVHAIRLGDIVGIHKIIFCGNSERIEIIHEAHSRDLFALGALEAVNWIIKKKNGLYSMQDVLV